MHPAWCIGWLRPGMETPIHYALWLGYIDYDRGLPDQYFGYDGNREPTAKWGLWAGIEE